MFYEKRCSQKFCKIHRKLPAPEPLLQACSFIKKDTLTHVFSCELCEISKNTLFTEHLWTTASVFSLTMGRFRTLPRPPVIVVVNLLVSLFFFQPLPKQVGRSRISKRLILADMEIQTKTYLLIFN